MPHSTAITSDYGGLTSNYELTYHLTASGRWLTEVLLWTPYTGVFAWLRRAGRSGGARFSQGSDRG
jgi:hypothetical protein